VRSGLDDNVVAALPTALVLYRLGYHWPPVLAAGAVSARGLGVALAVNLAVAALMGALRVVSPSGALAGGVAGFLILGAGGWRAYALLWVFFLLGTAATKLGYRRKAAAGTAQAQTAWFRPPSSCSGSRRSLSRRPSARRSRTRSARRSGRSMAAARSRR
jgi:uncharacterized membrane protein